MQPERRSPNISQYHQRNPSKLFRLIQFILIFAFAISTSSGQHVTIKMSDGLVLNNVLLGEMDGDSVTIQKEAILRKINIDQIQSIQAHHVVPTLRWIGAGLLLGVIVGATIDLYPDDDLNWLESSFVETVVRPLAILEFSFIGGLLGGAGSWIYARGWDYRLAGKSREEKIMLIQKLQNR